MDKAKIIVYLADDHNVVRKGMTRLLGTFNRVGKVREAANGKELLIAMKEGVPDVVIMDLEMPVMGGIEASKQIVELYPSVKILMLTMHTEEVFINKLMDIGIHGFLSKAAEPEEVERALDAVVDRDFYKNDIVERAIYKSTQSNTEEQYSKLTTRELEILLLICQELTPGEIGGRLQISEKTFFNHRANILSKVNARSNVGLLKYAIHKGFLTIS